MAIYDEGRFVTADALYAMEVSPETLSKYLGPRLDPERGEALRLFEPEAGTKPSMTALYMQSQRAERAA